MGMTRLFLNEWSNNNSLPGSHFVIAAEVEIYYFYTMWIPAVVGKVPRGYDEAVCEMTGDLRFSGSGTVPLAQGNKQINVIGFKLF